MSDAKQPALSRRRAQGPTRGTSVSRRQETCALLPDASLQLWAPTLALAFSTAEGQTPELEVLQRALAPVLPSHQHLLLVVTPRILNIAFLLGVFGRISGGGVSLVGF